MVKQQSNNKQRHTLCSTHVELLLIILTAFEDMVLGTACHIVDHVLVFPVVPIKEVSLGPCNRDGIISRLKEVVPVLRRVAICLPVRLLQQVVHAITVVLGVAFDEKEGPDSATDSKVDQDRKHAQEDHPVLVLTRTVVKGEVNFRHLSPSIKQAPEVELSS